MKRGVIAIQMLAWAVRAVFLVAVMVTLLFFIDAHINANITIFGAEAETLATRMLTSTHIMQHDIALQRTTLGVVDTVACAKLTNDVFDQMLSYAAEPKHIAGSLKVTDGKKTVCTVTFNKKFYDIIDVQSQAGGTFWKNTDERIIKLPVVLAQAGTKTSGFVEIRILGEA